MERNNRRNYYRILHVQPDAPPAVIRASYRTLMQRLRMHPDLGGDHWNAALVNEAYEVLSNPARRAEYDRARPDLRRPGAPSEQDATGAGPASPQGSPNAHLASCAFCHAPRPHSPAADPDPACRICGSPLTRASLPAGDRDWRRTVTRVPRDLPLRYWIDWPAPRGTPGTVLDLSLTGVRFAAAEPVLVDRFLKIDSTAFQSVARVVRCTASPEHWEIAAEFLTLRFARARGSFVSDLA